MKKKKPKQYVFTAKKDTQDLTQKLESAERKRDKREKDATGMGLNLKPPSFWK